MIDAMDFALILFLIPFGIAGRVLAQKLVVRRPEWGDLRLALHAALPVAGVIWLAAIVLLMAGKDDVALALVLLGLAAYGLAAATAHLAVRKYRYRVAVLGPARAFR
ncbi:hypothetical protein F1640_01265 [Novosphingobium sp. NBM11]|uniref:hypothetical protein n=1 Tax=Novosphingobium sp. NBM11 TaxID=2596914 RepID=UPI001892526B|nr:hypothetical protein [Novosphingobium sp. NBM11]MBF5088691.1 hypothetical protein [Novosphingobium sp. NBM11]